MTTALYAGSFDPIHLGHLGLIQTAAAHFERVYVAVTANPGKRASLFTLDERAALVHASAARLENVHVVVCRGLVVGLASEVGANVLLRGAGKEQVFEIEMAVANQALGGPPTVLLAPDAATSHLASRTIRARYAADGVDAVAHLVPPPVAEALARRAALLPIDAEL